MKKILTLFVFTLILSTQGKAQFNFGGGIAYYTEYKTVGIQANTLLGISEKVDLSGSATLAFENGTPIVFDFDAHYHFLTINDATILSPFAGINVVTQKDASDLGLNFGACLIIPIQDRKLYLETKYIISGVQGVVFTGGLFF